MSGARADPGGFWSRATLALGLTLYAWSMMGIELYLRAAEAPAGPQRSLLEFRRLVMGRAVVGLGAATVVAALVLAAIAKRHPLARIAAALLAVGWIACLIAIWPV